MATYKKQLRDKDNNVIYPAQGLGTITSDNIDWSTVTPRIIAAGRINVGSVGANTNKIGTVAIPTQADTNYVVLLSHSADVGSYDHAMPTSRDKTTNQFSWYVWNNSGATTGNIWLDYIVVKY